MDEFLGTVKIFGFNYAPRAWQPCDGRLLSISQNTALFSLLGTMYGGNGSTNFAVPDLRGRVALGMGQGPGLSNYVQGQIGGSEASTLTVSNMPAHTHNPSAVSTSTSNTTATLHAESTPANAQNPNDKMLASGTNIYAVEDPAQDRQMSAKSIVAATTTTTTTTVTDQVVGASLPFENRQPYLAVNYAICTEGIFPSRN